MPNTAKNKDIFALQAYIVNLATLYQLIPFKSMLTHFAQLHYHYANSWIFYPWFSKLWTRWKFYRHRALLNDYQAGKITSEHFLKNLSAIFYFLQGNVIDPELVLQNTWNLQINWNEQSNNRLNYLLQLNKPIYFIANCDQLHIEAIKRHIQCNRRLWRTMEIDNCQFDSYNNIALMSTHANNVDNTTDLLEKLAHYLAGLPENPNPVLLVSQCDDDLDCVQPKKLGFYIQTADQFYANVSLESRRSLPVELGIAEEESTLSTIHPITKITEQRTRTASPPRIAGTSSSVFQVVRKQDDEPDKPTSQSLATHPHTERSPLISRITHSP